MLCNTEGAASTMSERRTEREALLEARVKELEAAAAFRQNRDASGGIFEQAWRFLSDLATVKAELDKAQQEAARAKVDADAQNSMVEDATVRLATLQAEVSNKQAEAAKAKAAADAANQKFGLQTLEERAATAKLALSELEAADKCGSAAGQAALGSGGSIGAAYLKTARAICENNRYAQLINCPEEFITIAPSAPQTQVSQGSAQPDPGKPLRKPSLFDCARAWMGADYVICSSDALLDAEARLEDVYRTAHAARGDAVKTEQWAWIKRYGPACGLPLVGRPAPDQINEARGCIADALNQRIRELQAEQ
jgi:hypothetical protein